MITVDMDGRRYEVGERAVDTALRTNRLRAINRVLARHCYLRDRLARTGVHRPCELLLDGSAPGMYGLLGVAMRLCPRMFCTIARDNEWIRKEDIPYIEARHLVSDFNYMPPDGGDLQIKMFKILDYANFTSVSWVECPPLMCQSASVSRIEHRQLRKT